MKLARSFSKRLLWCLWAIMVLGFSAMAQDSPPQPPAQPAFKPEELEQIVAPIALYPDSLLAQIFMASTYPLEIVEAARWSKANPKVTGDALQTALEKQTWDPAVKSLTAFPDVLAGMNDKLDWTQKLGDAFLADQKGVMDAVQRLRAKAKAEGNLSSSKEQKVTTEPAPAGSSTTTIIEIAPTDPEVVYVPTYNPTVVYGAWAYPAYPPYPVYAYPPGAAFFSFTAGVIVGGALWGNCNWGHSDVDINVNNYNNFNRTDINNRNTNINNRDTNVSNRGNNQSWQHNPEHRKGVEYRDTGTQQKFGKASNPQAISQCETVGTDRLTTSTWPMSWRQSVVHSTPLSAAMVRAVCSSTSQTETNSDMPSFARFAWIRACCRPKWPTPITAVRSVIISYVDNRCTESKL